MFKKRSGVFYKCHKKKPHRGTTKSIALDVTVKITEAEATASVISSFPKLS